MTLILIQVCIMFLIGVCEHVYFCHWLIQPFTPGTGLTQRSVQHKVICF